MDKTDQTENANMLVDALNGTFGRHAGYRASHAKGGAVRGRFHPAPINAGLAIPLLRHQSPVTARFSIGGGKPGISDKSQTVRGFGLAIEGEQQCWILALTSNPVFFANSAEQFRAFLEARVPDPALGGPNPERVKAFNAANPNTIPHQAYLAATAPCRCYTEEIYHSAHAYGFDAEDGSKIYGRVFLRPDGGRQGLNPQELAELGDTFLQQRLAERLAQNESAFWTLGVMLAGDGDRLDDPTEPWGEDRKEIILGRIEIDAILSEEAVRVFDPSILPHGVYAPQDKVFHLRSAAYYVSHARRTGTEGQ